MRVKKWYEKMNRVEKKFGRWWERKKKEDEKKREKIIVHNDDDSNNDRGKERLKWQWD